MLRVNIIALLFILLVSESNAQVVKPTSGGSKKGLVMEQIGII
jgi:hypothetical protein